MRHKSENLEKAWAHTQRTAALRRYVKLTSADSQHKEVVTVKWPIPDREGYHRTRFVCKQCRGMTMSPQRMLLRKCEPSRQVRGWYTKRSNLIKALRELSATEEVNNLIKLVDPDQQVPSSYTFGILPRPRAVEMEHQLGSVFNPRQDHDAELPVKMCQPLCGYLECCFSTWSCGGSLSACPPVRPSHTVSAGSAS